MIEHHEIVAAIIERGDLFLIAQRQEGQHLAGYWEFPGGKLEAGEDHEAGLIRECREELGIEIELGRLCERTEYTYPQKRVVINFYFCRLLSGTPQPLSSEFIRWVSRDRLGDYCFPEANEAVLSRLRNGH